LRERERERERKRKRELTLTSDASLLCAPPIPAARALRSTARAGEEGRG
jgi:hypothetical protein